LRVPQVALQQLDKLLDLLQRCVREFSRAEMTAVDWFSVRSGS
jgi:hypothetical protein